jgi:hypothetical protein
VARAAGRQTEGGADEKCVSSIFHNVVLLDVFFTKSTTISLSWREKSTIRPKPVPNAGALLE